MFASALFAGEDGRRFDKDEPLPQNSFSRAFPSCAQVAELADALDSGSSAGNGVEVRILSWAPTTCGFSDFSKTPFLMWFVTQGSSRIRNECKEDQKGGYEEDVFLQRS